MEPKMLVSLYCKIPYIKNIGFNLKGDILKEISSFLSLNKDNEKKNKEKKEEIEKIFSKPTSKISYNNILFFKEIGFTCKINCSQGNYYLILKNSTENFQFMINRQTYFNYILIDNIKNKFNINNKFKKFFNPLGFVNENLIKIEHSFETVFRITCKIYFKNNEYICVELLERDNLDKYGGIHIEQLRIGKLISFPNDEKCKRFYVFWDTHLTNNNYIEYFMKNLISFIEDYDETEEEYFLKNKTENLNTNYNLIKVLLTNNNSITVDEINGLILWKDNIKEKEFYILFKASLVELGLFENYKDGYLNHNELLIYISKLNLYFVKDEIVLSYWCNLNDRIQKEYQNSLREYYKRKLSLMEKPVFGMNDIN